MPKGPHSWYGWRPDVPDRRDLRYASIRRLGAARLPPSADLRGGSMPPVYDQGALGSCTANALSAAVDFCRAKQGESFLTPSRLFIYWNERAMEGTLASDSGAALRDGIKTVKKPGVCPEAEWPYVISRFAKKPPAACFADAVKSTAISYHRVQGTRLDEVKACLAEGFPFVFGFTVYESFETAAVAKSGKVPVPKKGEKVLGGHAVLASGYSDAKKCVLVRNSWGADWGVRGYFWMPYAYIADSNLADDFWTIRQES